MTAGKLSRLIPPKAFEPIRRKRGIPCGVLNVSVSKVSLQCAGIVTVVCELVAASVAKHVGVSLDP